MADEVQVQSQGPGNGFKVDLKERKLGITGPIVIPVLALMLVAGIGWVRSQDLKAGQAVTNDHLQKLYERQDVHKTELVTLLLNQVEQLRSQLRAQTELVNSEGEQIRASLRENRELSASNMAKQNELLAEQTTEVRKHHAIIIFNQGHEQAQHLTLDLPVPPASPQ